jgi:hypothetical protein
MNEYLIYTFGGSCQDPNGDDIDNCQVLGRVKGKDEVEAIENLILENPWIIDSGYERKDFMIVQILNTNPECIFYKVLPHIEDQLLSMCDTKEESLSEIKRYMEHFPHESDFNIVQYGKLLVYYDQLREFYHDCGCKSMEDKSDDEVWETYKKNVGNVANQLIKKMQ